MEPITAVFYVTHKFRMKISQANSKQIIYVWWKKKSYVWSSPSSSSLSLLSLYDNEAQPSNVKHLCYACAILTKVWPAHNFTRHYHYRRWSSSLSMIIIITDHHHYHQWSSLSSLDPVAAFAFWKSFSFQSPSFTAQYKVSLSLNCTFTVQGTFRVHRDNKTQTTTFSSGIAAGLRWAAC